MKPIKEQAEIFRSQGWSTQEVGKLLQWAGYSLADVRDELGDQTIPKVTTMPDQRQAETD